MVRGGGVHSIMSHTPPHVLPDTETPFPLPCFSPPFFALHWTLYDILRVTSAWGTLVLPEGLGTVNLSQWRCVPEIDHFLLLVCVWGASLLHYHVHQLREVFFAKSITLLGYLCLKSKSELTLKPNSCSLRFISQRIDIYCSQDVIEDSRRQ